MTSIFGNTAHEDLSGLGTDSSITNNYYSSIPHDVDGNYDMENLKLTNVANPTLDQDAVTLAYFQTNDFSREIATDEQVNLGTSNSTAVCPLMLANAVNTGFIKTILDTKASNNGTENITGSKTFTVKQNFDSSGIGDMEPIIDIIHTEDNTAGGAMIRSGVDDTNAASSENTPLMAFVGRSTYDTGGNYSTTSNDSYSGYNAAITINQGSGTPSNTSSPGKIQLLTTPTNGIVPVKRLEVQQDGNVDIPTSLSVNSVNIESTLTSHVNETTTAHGITLADVGTNTSNISTNAGQISTNSSNISTNISNISTNSSNISTNTSNISGKVDQTHTGDIDVTGLLTLKTTDDHTPVLDIDYTNNGDVSGGGQIRGSFDKGTNAPSSESDVLLELVGRSTYTDGTYNTVVDDSLSGYSAAIQLRTGAGTRSASSATGEIGFLVCVHGSTTPIEALLIEHSGRINISGVLYNVGSAPLHLFSYHEGSATDSGDTVGELKFRGARGSGTVDYSGYGASLRVDAEETFTSSTQASKIILATTPTTTTSFVDRMEVLSNGTTQFNVPTSDPNIDIIGDGTAGGVLRFSYDEGSSVEPSDTIGEITFRAAYDASSNFSGIAARIKVEAAGENSNSSHPGNMFFQTTDALEVAPTTALRITSAGWVYVDGPTLTTNDLVIEEDKTITYGENIHLACVKFDGTSTTSPLRVTHGIAMANVMSYTVMFKSNSTPEEWKHYDNDVVITKVDGTYVDVSWADSTYDSTPYRITLQYTA